MQKIKFYTKKSANTKQSGTALSLSLEHPAYRWDDLRPRQACWQKIWKLQTKFFDITAIRIIRTPVAGCSFYTPKHEMALKAAWPVTLKTTDK